MVPTSRLMRVFSAFVSLDRQTAQMLYEHALIQTGIDDSREVLVVCSKDIEYVWNAVVRKISPATRRGGEITATGCTASVREA